MSGTDETARFSADTHCLEPEDLWTSRLGRDDWIELAPTTRRLPGHMKDLRFEGKSHNKSIDYRRYQDPGHLVEGVWEASPEDSPYEEILYDSAGERMRDLDTDGVWGEVVHPNNGLQIFCTADTEFAIACARIYNDYVAENLASTRSHPGGIIPAGDIALAVTEIERIASLGLKGIELPMLSPQGMPYSVRDYDPIWAAAQEHRLVVSMHVGSGQLRPGNPLTEPEPTAAGPTQVMSEAEARDAEATDAMASALSMDCNMATTTGGAIIELVGGGVCERYPDLHFLIVETGAAWVAFLMQSMDNAFHVGLGTRAIRRESEVMRFLFSADKQPRWTYPLRPSEYVKRQFHVSFMEDHAALENRHITGTDVLVWGNDYPHWEGSWPKSRDAIELMTTRAALTPDEQAAIFGGTLANLYDIELPTCQ